MPSGSDLFSPEALQAAIDAEFAAIPPGRRGALVGYCTRQGTWRVSVVHRIGDAWALGATISRDAATGQITGGVRVLGSW